MESGARMPTSDARMLNDTHKLPPKNNYAERLDGRVPGPDVTLSCG